MNATDEQDENRSVEDEDKCKAFTLNKASSDLPLVIDSQKTNKTLNSSLKGSVICYNDDEECESHRVLSKSFNIKTIQSATVHINTVNNPNSGTPLDYSTLPELASIREDNTPQRKKTEEVEEVTITDDDVVEIMDIIHEQSKQL